ncbi:LysR family transcriptional regulator [Vibrio sonorensis]|uniref:LysR family transcriptional regulator n=1 Tax=Vibrio sonorensis TaxID=1004316 RepID=UPI000AF0EF40|nr:LysR family transcriptional regulator [Vibrio sonorensis]
MKSASYNQIVIFHTIAQEGSIRGAARKLEIAPPSVSQSLKLLESKLGIPLFRRSTRQMKLTEAGQYLLENTADAISTLDQALEGVQTLSRAPSVG